jgi:hypothetical protein
MANAAMLPRKLLILAIVLPLAAAVGYKLATPQSFTTVGLLAAVIFTLCIPIFIRWHHPILIFAWNASINVFFLPGSPRLWILFSAISFFIAIMDRLLTKQQTFQQVPSLIWPLVMLLFVVVVTAKLTGGIGLRSLGGESYGGRRYFFVIASIIGFFALIGRRIPLEKANRYGGLFLLSGLTSVVAHVIYPFPSLYFLYNVFPVESAVEQASAEYNVLAGVMRYTGIGFSAAFAYYYLLSRFGVKGLLDPTKPWRMLLLMGVLFLGLLGGYRSILIMCFLIFALHFYLEKLHRTRLILVVGVIGILLCVALFSFSDKLPLSVQRSLSVIPGLEVNPIAKYDADVTLEWRVQMWKLLLPEVPRYFWVGKGWSMNPTELYLLMEAAKRGLTTGTDITMASGNYHNGPLTLMLHLGIFGVIAFLWFIVAGLIALYRNFRYGVQELRTINTFLFAYFLMRLCYFLFFYGHFAEDLCIFTGVLGLSVSLNGGMRKAPESELLPVTAPATVPVPA